jgi:protein CpxP
MGPRGGLPIRALNLTEAQQEQFRALTEQNRDQNRAALERLRTAMAAQRTAVETVPMNEQLIRSTTQELAEAQTEVALQRARLQTEFFALLSPEQQAQATKLQAERAGRLDQHPPRQRPGRR